MQLTLKDLKVVSLLLVIGFGTSGCVAAAVGAAVGTGYVIADESDEGDGNFDPLENVRGVGDGKN